MNVIKKSICVTNDYVREHLLRHMLWLGIVFAVTGIITFFGIRLLPEESLKTIYELLGEMFAGKDVVNSDGTLSFFGIFLNNFKAGVYIVLLGMVPFLFIPVMAVVLNSSVVGVVMGIIGVFSNENIVMAFIKYILPHGIFEIPAIVIQGAIGVKLCSFLCRKICGRAKNESFAVHIKGCVGTFIVYIIPLLLIAAFIEAVVLSALYQ